MEGDEAEYAWLPIHCLKPFEPLDATKEENHMNDDPNLSACIKAAEKVLADLNAAKQNDMNNHAAEDDADSDSDGGEHTTISCDDLQGLHPESSMANLYVCCAHMCTLSEKGKWTVSCCPLTHEDPSARLMPSVFFVFSGGHPDDVRSQMM